MWLAKKLENGSSVVFLREAVCIGDVAWRAPFGRLEDLYVNHFIIGSAFAATDWVYEAFRSLPLAQQQELWRDTVQVATPQGPVDVPLADLNSVQARQVISWLDEYRSNTPNPCLRNLEEQLEWLRGQYRLSKGWVAYFQARQGAAVARLRQGQPAEADPADLIEAALPDPPAAAINARRDARRRARQSRSKKL